MMKQYAKRSSCDYTQNKNQKQEENFENIGKDEILDKFHELQQKYNQLQKQYQDIEDESDNQKQKLDNQQYEIEKINLLKKRLQQMKEKNQKLEDEIDLLKQKNEQLRIQQLNSENNNIQIDMPTNNISLSAFQVQKELQEKDQKLKEYVDQIQEYQENFNQQLSKNLLLNEQDQQQQSLIQEYTKLNDNIKLELQIIRNENNCNIQLINQLKHQIEKNSNHDVNEDDLFENQLTCNTLLSNGVIFEEKENTECHQQFENVYQSQIQSSRNNNQQENFGSYLQKRTLEQKCKEQLKTTELQQSTKSHNTFLNQAIPQEVKVKKIEKNEIQIKNIKQKLDDLNKQKKQLEKKASFENETQLKDFRKKLSQKYDLKTTHIQYKINIQLDENQ